MSYLRRAILAVALIAGIVPAIAQVPPPVPALPDAERRISYSITASTCACSLGANLNLYGDGSDYQNWVEVYLNGVLVNYNDATYGWTITSQSGTPLANLSRPITDGVLTFNNVQTGTVQIVGALRPRRTVQFTENQPVPARNLNYAITYIVSGLREVWDKINDFTGRVVRAPPGETLATLPPAAQRANMSACFDSNGNLVPCASIGSSTFIAGNGITFSGSNPTTITNNIQAGTGISITGTNPMVIAATAGTPPVALPGGRLTLVSGQAEMTADISSQNLYYAPDQGNTCPIYNGSTWASYQFTSGVSDQVGLTLALGGSSNWPSGTIFDVFCVLNGGVPVLATRTWDSSMLPTFTQISNNTNTVITTGSSGTTWSNTANAFNGTLSQPVASVATATGPNATLNNCIGQDLGSGNKSVLTKVALTEPNNASFRGDDPTTLITSTYGSNDNTNWQRLDASRNILSTSATYGNTYTYFINAIDATPYRYFRVCFTGSSSSNNIHIAQVQLFTTTAPSTRRLTRFNGVLVNDAAITARISSSSTISIPQNQATYLGSIQTDAATAGQVTANFGYGPSRVMNIWNYYNRKPVTIIAGIAALSSALPGSATFNYSLTWPTWQDWQGVQSSTSYSVQVLVGYVGDNVKGSFARAWYLNGSGGSPAAYEFGIGIDTTISFSGSEGGTTGDGLNSTETGYFGTANVTLPPFFGTHTLNGIEKLTYSPTGTVQAFMNIGNTGLSVTTSY